MGTTVQKIENDEFSDDIFVAALMENVIDENNIHDWSKLDTIAVGIARAFDFPPSLFGTFDFDATADTAKAVQKQRRVRRKVDVAEEKRPTSVTKSSTIEAGNTKIEKVLNTIKEVSRCFYILCTKVLILSSN